MYMYSLTHDVTYDDMQLFCIIMLTAVCWYHFYTIHCCFTLWLLTAEDGGLLVEGKHAVPQPAVCEFCQAALPLVLMCGFVYK